MQFNIIRRGVCAIAVAALASGGFVSAAMAQSVTVNFLSAQNDDVFQPVIDAFEAANPDIDVVHQTVPFDELNTAIETRVARGDGTIDIYAADTPRIPAFASRGYLLNLDDTKDEITAAVPSAVELELVSHRGSVWAYPMWTSTQLMYFNRDLLKAANLDMPDGGTSARMTWEQVTENANAAKDAGAEWGMMFQQVDRYYQLQALFESSGAGNGLTGDDLLEPDMNGDKWVETAQWYADIFENGLAPRGVSPSQTDDLFARGKVAYYVAGPWAIAAFNAAEGLDYGVAPHPYFEGGKQVTPTGAWALGINPHADNLEAAKKFAEFVTLTAEGSFLTTKNFPLIPVNSGGFEKYGVAIGEMTPKIGPALDIMAHEGMETAVARPRTVGFVAFETEMNRMFSDVRNGADVKQALDDTQSRLSGLLPRQR
ncbi:ABC-type sugar transport system, periplasmic component [Hoeflea sp. IMCC20628]|uniref:sugar ABC transporter substrate-binding protein n=1 Tax=Hoeflea sp. IMCC20628 TaxID=1620421 RepID=UPI00063BEB0F|nr:sugar ABC transporter substrate-binding protein [Hoeflea sp. IMCC20628]AKI00746.1 ABC-type sugar transport system, periplasmic component [Hoeflea sp. IMCC20628]